MDFTLTFKNNTNKILHYQTFNNDLNLQPIVYKKEIKPNEFFSFMVEVPLKNNLQGVIVFEEFIILIMNNLQVKMGSNIFQIPNNKSYKSIITKQIKNPPNPNVLLYCAVDLEIMVN